MPTIVARIEHYVRSHGDLASRGMTIRIGARLHKQFLASAPIALRAKASLGSRGFAHDGVVYVFDDGDYAHAVVSVAGSEMARIDPPGDGERSPS